MRVTIERRYCVGHAMCHMNSPDVFGRDDEGYGFVETEDVPASLEDSARQGASACPEQAITIEE